MRGQLRFPSGLALALAVLGLAGSRGGQAQTNERIYETLDFRFVTPGARAIGMGKTFIGLADDATAAFSNPAGLSNLLAKEFSLEVQGTDIRHQRLTSLQPGEPVATRTFGSAVWEPSFLSFVLPMDRWTISLFANTVQAYREEFAFEGRPVPELGGPEDGAFGSIDAQNRQYGLGLSFVASRRLSLGGSLVVSSLRLAGAGRSGTPLNPRNGTDTRDRGTAVTGIAGLLVKPARGVSLGASFFGGASFDLETTLFGSFLEHGSDVIKTGTVVPIEYVVPPRLGLGASWRIADRLTLLADANRVWYSRQVGDEFRIVDFQDPDFGLTRRDFYVADVWELHAGAEYRIYGRSLTVALRAGVFTDPDHRLRFRKTGASSVASTLLDFRFNSVADQTDLGLTFGLGVMLANRVQLDAAGSVSPDAREVVVSIVLRP